MRKKHLRNRHRKRVAEKFRFRFFLHRSKLRHKIRILVTLNRKPADTQRVSWQIAPSVWSVKTPATQRYIAVASRERDVKQKDDVRIAVATGQSVHTMTGVRGHLHVNRDSKVKGRGSGIRVVTTHIAIIGAQTLPDARARATTVVNKAIGNRSVQLLRLDFDIHTAMHAIRSTPVAHAVTEEISRDLPCGTP